MYQYCVVDFLDENEVEAVPKNWLIGRDRCMWLPFTSAAKVTKAIQNCIDPDDTWTSFKVQVYKNGDRDDYDEARQAAKRAENSDLQTDPEELEGGSRKRKRIPNTRYMSSEVDSTPTKILKKRKVSKIPSASSGSEDEGSDFEVPPPPNPPQKFGHNEITTDFVPAPPNGPGSGSSKIALKEKARSPVRNIPKSPNKTSTTQKTRSSPRKLPSNSGDEFHRRTSGCHQNGNSNTTDSTQDKQHRPPTFTSPTKRNVGNSLTAVNAHVIAALADIKTSLRNVTSMLQSLTAVKDAELPQEIDIPIDTMDEFGDFEEKLKDSEIRKQLIQSLGTVGGCSVETTVRRILNEVISHKLSLRFNWAGKGKSNKTAFKNSLLLPVINVAVRRNASTRKATNADIADIIKDWFRFAKDRKGGRRTRRN